MKSRTAAIGAILVLVPALALAQKVSYDYDKSASFGGFKTYALKDGTKSGDPLIDNRITSALETQLAAKGLTKNDASPDITVVYHVGVEKQKDISTWSTGGGPYGYGWGAGWGSTDIRVSEILMGTLIVDVADARKKAVVWRSIGTKQIDVHAKPEKRDKNINQAVQKILKNFPPKPTT